MRQNAEETLRWGEIYGKFLSFEKMNNFIVHKRMHENKFRSNTTMRRKWKQIYISVFTQNIYEMEKNLEIKDFVFVCKMDKRSWKMFLFVSKYFGNG